MDKHHETPDYGERKPKEKRRLTPEELYWVDVPAPTSRTHEASGETFTGATVIDLAQRKRRAA